MEQLNHIIAAARDLLKQCKREAKELRAKRDSTLDRLGVLDDERRKAAKKLITGDEGEKKQAEKEMTNLEKEFQSLSRTLEGYDGLLEDADAAVTKAEGELSKIERAGQSEREIFLQKKEAAHAKVIAVRILERQNRMAALYADLCFEIGEDMIDYMLVEDYPDARRSVPDEMGRRMRIIEGMSSGSRSTPFRVSPPGLRNAPLPGLNGQLIVHAVISEKEPFDLIQIAHNRRAALRQSFIEEWGKNMENNRSKSFTTQGGRT